MNWLFWNLYGSCISPRPLLSWKKPGNFSFDNMGPLTPAFSCRQERHLDAKLPPAPIELISTNYWYSSVCGYPGVAAEPEQHNSWKCGVRVQGRKEELVSLTPKQTSGNPCDGEKWRSGSSSNSSPLLSLSHKYQWNKPSTCPYITYIQGGRQDRKTGNWRKLQHYMRKGRRIFFFYPQTMLHWGVQCENRKKHLSTKAHIP